MKKSERKQWDGWLWNGRICNSATRQMNHSSQISLCQNRFLKFPSKRDDCSWNLIVSLNITLSEGLPIHVTAFWGMAITPERCFVSKLKLVYKMCSIIKMTLFDSALSTKPISALSWFIPEEKKIQQQPLALNFQTPRRIEILVQSRFRKFVTSHERIKEEIKFMHLQFRSTTGRSLCRKENCSSCRF